MQRILKIVLAVLLCGAVWLSFDAWWMPLEARQQAAAAAATGGPYAAGEAYAFAEALWGALRVAAPLGAVVVLAALFQLERLSPFLVSTGRGFAAATSTSGQLRNSRQTWLIRAFIAVWFVIAVSQFGGGVMQRLRDWYAYRLSPGQVSLPNISETNRQVIRYVESATPEDARILVLSDQKLFFLSYYLLPRRLFHPMHPDSEFVIPLANGARQLAAYTRDDLPPGYLEKLKPDYVLEYFEGKEFVDPARVLDDSNWIRFLGPRLPLNERPNIQVILRPYRPEETP